MNVKAYLKERFVSGRTIGFYLALGAAVLFLISDIIFVAVDAGDRTFSYVTFALILVGAAIEIVSVFFDYKFLDFLPVVSCACYGVAFGMHLYLGLPTLSDRWNGVNFVGGNGDAVITFAILFGIGLVAALAACFMKRRRSVEEQ